MPQVTKYGLLCSVEIEHAYYRNNIPRDFVLEPSAETRNQLKNWGMLYKPEPNGFKLIGSLKTISLLKNEESNTVPLSFYLFNHNPYFLNFTALPLSFNQIANREILYFDNGNIKEDNLLHTEPIAITSEEEESAKPSYIVSYGAPEVTLILQKEEPEPGNQPPPNQIWMVHKEGEEIKIDYRQVTTETILRTEKILEEKRQYFVKDQMVHEESFRKGQRVFQLDLDEWPEGQYAIFINDVEKIKRCTLKRAALVPPLGLVNIDLSGILEKWGEDTKIGPTYKINFGNRETTWRYIFRNETEELKINSVSVSSKKGDSLNGQQEPYEFTALENEEPNDLEKKVLVSTKGIGLQENYDWKALAEVTFEKKDKKPISIKDIALPFATPNRIEIIKDKKEILSEIYVYI